MTTQYDLVIFDLDGTLINSITDLAHATNYALQKLGHPTHEVESYKMMVGNGVMRLLKRALPEAHRDEEEQAKLRVHFTAYYDVHGLDYTQPYEGIDHLLQQLKQAGVLMAVASNKYDKATRHLVQQFFPDVPFAAVLGQREGVPVKPDPQIVNDVLAITGIDRERTLYVGDSGVDMRTAIAANVDACAVTWGFRQRDELTAFGPAYLAESPEQIAQIVLKAN